MKHIFHVVLVVTFAVWCCITQGHAQTSAHNHLDRALRLGNAYNWVEAGPEFVEAERLFVAEGDQKNAYYARLGKMRSTLQFGALPEVIVQLGEDLDSLTFLQR